MLAFVVITCLCASKDSPIGRHLGTWTGIKNVSVAIWGLMQHLVLSGVDWFGAWMLWPITAFSSGLDERFGLSEAIKTFLLSTILAQRIYGRLAAVLGLSLLVRIARAPFQLYQACTSKLRGPLQHKGSSAARDKAETAPSKSHTHSSPQSLRSRSQISSQQTSQTSKPEAQSPSRSTGRVILYVALSIILIILLILFKTSETSPYKAMNTLILLFQG